MPRLFIDTIKSIGAVVDGDNEPAEILFTKAALKVPGSKNEPTMTKARTMTTKPKTETITDAINTAVNNRAILMQHEQAAMFGKNIAVVRAQVWQSEIGRQLVALMRRHGDKPYSSVSKHAPDAAASFIRKWRTL